MLQVNGHCFEKEIRQERQKYQKKANWGSLMVNKVQIQNVVYFCCKKCYTSYQLTEDGIPGNIKSCEEIIMEKVLGNI